ncbi:hypothetical protein A4R26_19110 [Niastella populi]|uniref:Uncharacterized protein n=1 Tax=Niastella populi TaxID=550983 RepID=A0A1V9FTL6_9BACT|nr:hypothetical protein A4R26_19110 [Niastella populi]
MASSAGKGRKRGVSASLPNLKLKPRGGSIPFKHNTQQDKANTTPGKHCLILRNKGKAFQETVEKALFQLYSPSKLKLRGVTKTYIHNKMKHRLNRKTQGLF